MTAAPPKAAVAMATAIERTFGSPAWAAAVLDDLQPQWMLPQALCEGLHPPGPVAAPSVARLREHSGRRGRNEEIRAAFDGRNYRELARRHRLSTRQVRRIVDDPRKEG
ncbi:MAG: hypothetical protein OXH75_28770 [Acidobacteria bacterium]|nr:hypothetical protein [Acidobacteriota bacterium]